MNKAHALLFALMMMTVSLAGCFGGDANGSNEDETPVETLDDWQVHFANTASDLPECDDNRDGWLYYVSTDENFRVCTQFGWELVDITGPSGTDGTNGADGTIGVDGQNGADGTNGTDGMDGQDGTSILINVVISTACLNGGNTFEIGSDDDSDGVLDVTEVGVTVDICNGADGQDGADGADGAQGPAGADGLNAIVSMTPESAGSNCANGGTRIDVGVDDNSNGVLETSEIDQTQYVCDGGSSNNTMLTSISSPPSAMGCDAGGQVVSHGLDNGDGGGTYANGILEPGEVDASTTLCSRYSVAILIDINTGSGSSSDSTALMATLTAVGNTLYFQATDGTNGYELWKSDGTASGTVMVKDIRSGSGSSYPNSLTAIGTTLYFVANDGYTGHELYSNTGVVTEVIYS